MIRVRCISNWSDSYPLHLRIIKQFAPDYESQNELRFVDDDSYDYLVIFNDAKGFKPKVSKEKILGFIQEPHDHSKYYDRNLGSQCAKVYTCSDRSYYPNNSNYTSAPSAMFYSMNGSITEYLGNNDFKKPHKLSIVVSGINPPNTFYNTRHDVLKRILDSDLDCHVYGRGLNISDSRYKGAPDNKADALLPYEYSIAIENGRFTGYVSEKYFDCILCNTVPVYLGAPDIYRFFISHYELPNPNSFFIDNLKALPKPKEAAKRAILQEKQIWHENHNLFNLIKNFTNGTN